MSAKGCIINGFYRGARLRLPPLQQPCVFLVGEAFAIIIGDTGALCARYLAYKNSPVAELTSSSPRQEGFLTRNLPLTEVEDMLGSRFEGIAFEGAETSRGAELSCQQDQDVAPHVPELSCHLDQDETLRNTFLG